MTMRDQTYSGDARAVGRDAHDERERDLEGMRPLNAGRGAGEPVVGPGGAGAAGADIAASGGPRERSITDLLKELRDESSALLRQEVALAKTEMAEKASAYGKNAASVATGATVAYAGALFILIAVTIGLGMILDRFTALDEHAWWLAPLIVGGIVAIIGYAMIQKGVSTLKRQSPVPEKTIQSLQEDKQWLTNKMT
ncbi:MAG TPA: phage holin family protein [Tepidisphaeraceae bacterium]|nr:phage holin family protein [Tepidisphaeraceae bacterium]